MTFSFIRVLIIILYRIFLVFHSCILFFYVFNSNLIYFYLNLLKSYVYLFNVKHQEQLRGCGAI